MKKKILVIHHGYSLGLTEGDKIRTQHMLRSLDRIGFEIYFVAFFTRGFFRLRREKKIFSSPVRKVFYLFSLPNRLHLNQWALTLRCAAVWCICRRYGIDVIQAEMTPSASCTKWVTDIPLVTDFHADMVPELSMRNFSRHNLNHAAKDNVYALKRSIRTITVSQNLHQNLLAYYDRPKANCILPCNFDPAPFLALPEDAGKQMRRKYGLEDRMILCYSGGLYRWQCTDETLAIVLQLYRVNPRYFFCLYTIDATAEVEKKLQPMAGNYLIKKLSTAEIPAYLSMIDAGFVLRENSPVNINASPTKASEYFAAGALVITSPYAGDVPELIAGAGHGVVLDKLTLSGEEITTLDRKITAHCDRREAYARHIREYIFRNRVWDFNERKLQRIYEDLQLLPNQNTLPRV